MLSPEEVNAIVANTVAALKPYYRDGEVKKATRKDASFIGGKKSTPWPEYWPGYNECVKLRDELAVHIEHGVFPDHLIHARSPNQTDAEFEYVKANFKQVTLPHAVDYMNMIRRALHESNWRITYPPEAPEDLQSINDTGFVGGMSLAEWASSVLIEQKTLDPMGAVCVMPVEIPAVMGVDDEGNERLVADPDVPPMPTVHLFPVDRVIGFDSDRWFMLNTHEQSVVKFGNQSRRIGMVFWIIDEVNCWRVAQTGNATDLTFSVELHFQHDTGFVPCKHLLGKPRFKDGNIIWDSRFLPAKDLFDLVLLDSTYLLSSKSNSAYPMRVMLGHHCEHVDSSGHSCIGGTLMGVGDDGMPKSFGTCQKCNGTGISARMGPHGVLFAMEQQRGDNPPVKTQDAMTFVEPSGHTMKFLREEMQANTNEGRRMLHLYSETPIAGGEAETATQVGVGVKAQNAFIKPESDQVFLLMDFVTFAICRQRYGSEERPYTIIAAVEFDLRTEADHFAEIAAAIDKGLPPAMIEQAMRSYIHARFATDPESRDAFEAIMRADRLFTVDWQTIAMMEGKGQVQGWEVALHADALSIYERLVNERGFADLDPIAKADKMRKWAEANLKAAESTNAVPGREIARRLVEETEEETEETE